jgi:hypothetical protein
MADSIRIIKDLEAGLTLWTEPAFVDWIIFNSLQLDRPMIDGSNSEATSAGTLKADTRRPILLVRNPFPFFGQGTEEFIRQGRSPRGYHDHFE